jgi:hypothetical protein
MKVSELRQLIREQVTQVLAESINEAFGVVDIKDIHFETDPVKAETLKKAYGKATGEMFPSKQIESANYALAKFRKQIKYDNGKSGTAGSTDVFIPGSSMAAFSTLGDGPHKKAITRKTWNQREYDKWIKSMAGDSGAENAYDMAQNAKHEPGLIDWVKRNVVYDETPLERIQWDIEAYS